MSLPRSINFRFFVTATGHLYQILRHVGSLWSAEYPDDPFILFGTPHVSVLLLVGVCAVLLILRRNALSSAARNSLRRGTASLLVVNELLWHVWALTQNLYLLQEMLPLHLCSVMVWVSAFALWTEERRLYGAMYFLGVAGALQALLTPDAGVYGFPHFRFLQTMISHGLVFLSGVYVVTVEGYRPTPRSALLIFAGLNLYALVVGLFNAGVGSNYLYVNAKPETPSIIDLMPPWPWYLLYLELIALGFVALLCAPFLRRVSIRGVAPEEVEDVPATVRD